MTPENIIYTISLIIAALFFAYFYWKDSTEEGYSPNKIFDSCFLMLLGGLIGGKLMFRPLSMDYFKYQFWSAPLILEGVLMGGGIAIAIYVRRNGWDMWKIGDMLAAALSIFSAVIFTGFAIALPLVDYIILSAVFYSLFGIIRYLRVRKQYGSSKLYFELKRYNKILFTGMLFFVYLTVSSMVAILFLAKNFNFSSHFWKLQVLFYLLILVVSFFLFIKKRRKSKTLENGR